MGLGQAHRTPETSASTQPRVPARALAMPEQRSGNGGLRLAPEVQEHILAMPEEVRRPAITERALRPVAQIVNPEQQIASFQRLVTHEPSTTSQIGGDYCGDFPLTAPGILSPHFGGYH